MKVLFRLIRKNRGWVIMSFIISFITIGVQMVWSINIGRLGDCIEQRTAITVKLLTLLGCLLILGVLTQYLNQLVSRYASERLGHTLRMDFAKSCLNALSDRGRKTGSFEAMSRVQNELCQASEYMSNTLFDIFGMTLSALLVIAFLFTRNVILTMTLLVPIIIITVIARKLGKKIVPLVQKSMDEKIRTNKVAYSMINSYNTVLVFDGKSFFKEKYEQQLEEWGKTELKKERISAFCNSMSGVLSQIPLLLLFAVGILMIWKGSITFGTLLIFLNMQKNVLRTIMNLPTWITSAKSFLTHLRLCQLGSEDCKET